MINKLLFVACMISTIIVHAQKAEKGNINVETQILLNNDSNFLSAYSPNIKLRYFLRSDIALRAQAIFTGINSESRIAQNPDGSGSSGSDIISNSSFMMALGAEKHFKGTEKLSPYLGAMFSIKHQSVSEDWTNYDGVIYNKNYINNISGATNDFISNPASPNRSGNTFGLLGVIGADYYFTNHVFLGFEMNWGFYMKTNTSVTQHIENNNGAVTNRKWLESSSNSIQLNHSGLRMGFIF